jgi:hypothetical protein
VRREDPGSGCREGQQPVYSLEECILSIGEREESIHSFLQKLRHKVVGAISGKHDEAGIRKPGFNLGDDVLDLRRRHTGVRDDHQIECFMRPVVERSGELAKGLHNFHTEIMLTEYLRKTGPNDILFRDDQDAMNCSTPSKMKAGSRIDTGFVSRLLGCQSVITSFVRRVETLSASTPLLVQTRVIPAGCLDSRPSHGPCIR